jgi:hypothetical protein
LEQPLNLLWLLLPLAAYTGWWLGRRAAGAQDAESGEDALHLEQLVETVFQERNELSHFNGNMHQRLLDDFQRMDSELFKNNRIQFPVCHNE